MKFIFLTFILLLASVSIHSEDINLADVDYCIDWISKETELDGGNFITDVHLVLVRKNSVLKNMHDTIKCVSSSPNRNHYIYQYTSQFYFIDELGQTVFSFLWRDYTSDLRLSKDGRCGQRAGCSDAEYLKARTWTLPTVNMDFPPTTNYIATTLKKFKKNDLLQFKNKIINANINVRVECEPDLDTTYRVNFRARITGECGCDSTEYKKNTQKNKK